MTYYKTIDTAIGRHLCGSDGEKITMFTLPGDYGKRDSDLPVFRLVEEYFGQYFDGEVPDVSVPLDLSSVSDFCGKVLSVVQKIPYGSVMTYGDIAAVIGAERGRTVAAQAVGGAVKRNPAAIIVPCHRVVAKDGVGGYFGAEALKISLLRFEAEHIKS